MKIKLIIGFAFMLAFYSCEKNPSSISEEKRPIIAESDTTKASAETDGSFQLQYAKPDADYKMMFTDQFTNNHIGDWWTARDEAKYIDWQNFTAYNRAINNSFSNGILSIKYDQDVDGKQYGGGIISKKAFGYGYYEARVKLYTGTYGLHQSFWSFATSLEIDGFEVDSKVTGALSPLHPGRHRWKPTHIFYHPTPAEESLFVGVPNTNIATSPNNSTDIWDDSDGTWYTVGYEWLPDKVKYYVNGVLKNTYNGFDNFGNDVNTFEPASVYLTALPYKVYTTYSMVQPQQGAKMQVDYFAYFAKRMPDVNLLGNSAFDYTSNSERDESITAWVDYPLTINGVVTYGANANDRLNCFVKKETSNWFLEHKNTAQAYKALTRQTLSFIRTGTYKLSADIRCSAAGSKFIVLDKNKTTVLATKIIPFSSSTDWVSVTLDGSAVNNNEVTIMIYSEMPANAFLQVDNIKFAIKP